MKVYKNPLDAANSMNNKFKYWDTNTYNKYADALEYGGKKGQEAHEMLQDDVQSLFGKRGMFNKVNSMQDLVSRLKAEKDVHNFRKKHGGEYNPGLVWRDKLPEGYDDQFPSRNLANIDDSFLGTYLRTQGYAFDDDPDITYNEEEDRYEGEYL